MYINLRSLEALYSTHSSLHPAPHSSPSSPPKSLPKRPPTRINLPSTPPLHPGLLRRPRRKARLRSQLRTPSLRNPIRRFTHSPILGLLQRCVKELRLLSFLLDDGHFV